MRIKFTVWQVLGLLVTIFFAFVFYKIVIYLTISLVLFLLGSPITYNLAKIRIGSKHLPAALASLITILIMIALVSGLFFLIVPPLAGEIEFLSELNFYEVLQNILAQFPAVKSLLLRFGNEEDLKLGISAELTSFLNTGNISLILNNVFSYFGAVSAGILCVLFITFFLLKDEKIVKEGLLLISPTGTENAMGEIMRTSKKMLSKYFTALFLDVLIVGCSVMIALTVLGIKNALIIAFCAALLNVIPYIGSVITMIIAIVLGVSSCISAGSYELIGPTINKIFFALLSINLIDGFIIQPLIFSNSVKAHPLEVFIVTLMAGTIGGIPGMVVALPVYTLIRIVAKEFLTHLKFFKRISDRISG